MMTPSSLIGLAAYGMGISSLDRAGSYTITNHHGQKLHATKTKKVQRKAKKLARRNNRRN